MHKYFNILFIQFSKYDGGSKEMRSEKSKINNVNLAEWIKKEKQTEDAGQQNAPGDAENN